MNRFEQFSIMERRLIQEALAIAISIWHSKIRNMPEIEDAPAPKVRAADRLSDEVEL